jgi:hypothetical protein
MTTPHHKPRNVRLTSVSRLRWENGQRSTGRSFRVSQNTIEQDYREYVALAHKLATEQL